MKQFLLSAFYPSFLLSGEVSHWQLVAEQCAAHYGW